MAPAGASWLAIPLAESEIYGYVEVDGTLEMMKCLDGSAISSGRIAGASSISSRIRAEVEEAVDRYAEQFHVRPGCSWQ